MTGAIIIPEKHRPGHYSMDKLIAKRMRLLDWEAFLLTFVRPSSLPRLAEPSIWKMELPDVVAAWFISRGNGGKA